MDDLARASTSADTSNAAADTAAAAAIKDGSGQKLPPLRSPPNLAALERQIEILATQVTQQAEELARLRTEPGEEGGDDNLTENDKAVVAHCENLYTSSVNIATATCPDRAGAWAVARSLIQLLVLLTVQTGLTLAFHDASVLLQLISDYVAIRDTLDSSVYYADTLNPSGVPKVNVVTSVLSIVLLGFYLYKDNLGTLLTDSVFERILFQDRSVRTRAWLAGLSVPL